MQRSELGGLLGLMEMMLVALTLSLALAIGTIIHQDKTIYKQRMEIQKTAECWSR